MKLDDIRTPGFVPPTAGPQPNNPSEGTGQLQGTIGVACGVRLEFMSKPTQLTAPRTAVMRPKQEALCNEEVRMLLGKEAIRKKDSAGVISEIFLIPKKSGGFRPIINLKLINKKFNFFVVYRHFKMEGIRTLKQLIRKGNFMSKLDLKDAYLTISMDPKHREWLR
jgi:hypothetical protein